MDKSNVSPNLVVREMKEFARFAACEQRYITRSIELNLVKDDEVRLFMRSPTEKVIRRWSRDPDEAASLKAQAKIYTNLKELQQLIPAGDHFRGNDKFLSLLIYVSAFDLEQGKNLTFSAYRFLYERLLGALIRQWLPSAFCAAAALPHIEPSRRKYLLHSISEQAATAPGWSTTEPCFPPEWVKKEAA